MRIEDVDANYVLHEPQADMVQTSSWNGRSIEYELISSQDAQYCLVSYVKKREKEIKRLENNMPDKNQDGQSYYTNKARIEQLKYEIRIKEAAEDVLRLHWYDASTKYFSAQNHLSRRTEAEAESLLFQRI